MKKDIQRRAFLLEYITILWNVGEGVVALIYGFITGSLSLVAFGLESVLEVLSSSVAVWDMRGKGQSRDQKSFRLLGIVFFIFAAYILASVVRSLFHASKAEPTLGAIAAMAVITIGMLTLGILKKRVAKKLKNDVMSAEANFTLLDATLSGSLVVSLLLTYVFGWWWLDKVFATALALNAIRQGILQFIRASKSK